MTTTIMLSTIILARFLNFILYIGPTNSEDGDSVRLVSNNSNSSGALEVNIDGKWGKVCGAKFSLLSGLVACQELGYASIKK